MGGNEGPQELEELRARAGGEEGSRMNDNVSVNPARLVSKVEADSEPSWIGVGIGVWDLWNAGGVGKSGCDRRGRIVEMWCRGELLGLWRGCKCTTQKESSSMRCQDTSQSTGNLLREAS